MRMKKNILVIRYDSNRNSVDTKYILKQLGGGGGGGGRHLKGHLK
jgi:hypothetical protein